MTSSSMEVRLRGEASCVGVRKLSANDESFSRLGEIAVYQFHGVDGQGGQVAVKQQSETATTTGAATSCGCKKHTTPRMRWSLTTILQLQGSHQPVSFSCSEHTPKSTKIPHSHKKLKNDHANLVVVFSSKHRISPAFLQLTRTQAALLYHFRREEGPKGPLSAASCRRRP